MKNLALERELPGKKSSDFQSNLRDEAWRVWELQKQDIVREI